MTELKAWPAEATRVLEEASRRYGQTTEQILSRDRHRPTMLARQYLYWKLRIIGWSYLKIAHLLGKDHSTIISGAERHAAGLADIPVPPPSSPSEASLVACWDAVLP